MKAKDAMFLGWAADGDKPARLEIVSRRWYLDRGVPIPCDYTMGAVFTKWKEIPDSQSMACVLCTGFHIVENYGVPVKDVTKELEKIEGFTEYWDGIGVMTGMLH